MGHTRNVRIAFAVVLIMLAAHESRAQPFDGAPRTGLRANRDPRLAKHMELFAEVQGGIVLRPQLGRQPNLATVDEQVSPF